MSRLVVIPSDPLSAYSHLSEVYLESYYNPQHFFTHVFCVSPLEKQEYFFAGMHVVPSTKYNYIKKIYELKPDVVRAYGGFWACDLACNNKLPGVPVIVSVHDTNPQLLYKSIVHADLVLCTAKCVADLVKSRGVNQRIVKILPNRIDWHTVFHPLVKPDITVLKTKIPSWAGKKILSIGRLVPQKNHDSLIRSLSFLPDEYAAFIVGKGDWSKLESVARECKVLHRCFWLESISNDDLPLLHAWADCFCTPSRWEGFGFVFIEAAACGNPVVTSNIAPMNEYLEHDESAWLVDNYENPQSLARAIRRVCEDDHLHRKLSTNGRRAVACFDKTKVDELEVSFYKTIILKKMNPPSGTIVYIYYRMFLSFFAEFVSLSFAKKLISGSRIFLRKVLNYGK